MKRLPLITSFVLFIALCVSAAYWTMQFIKPPVRAIAAPPQVERPAPPLDAAAGLLGGRVSFAVASNYQLKGVVVAANPAESIAILSANGKPAQAIRTHREILPGVTVQEVQRDHVLLQEGGQIKRVALSENPKARMSVADLATKPPPQRLSPNSSGAVNSPPPLGNPQYRPGPAGSDRVKYGSGPAPNSGKTLP